VAKHHPIPDALGRSQPTRVISEADVVRLILKSHLPAAERFERWLVEEVVPSIRRDGAYVAVRHDETPEQLAMRALQALMSAVDRQKAEIAELQPAADALARIADAEGSKTITDTAKELGMSPKAFTDWLIANHFAYRRHPGGPLVGRQERIDVGYVEQRNRIVTTTSGADKNTSQMRITGKGLAKIAKLIERGAATAAIAACGAPGH
jgi:phage antirepressor YoqD-like protein